MTIVRYKNRPAEKSFNNLIDDLFPQFPSLLSSSLINKDWTHSTPVNIRENETAYVLELIAPGWEKEDFKISLDKNQLMISAEKKESTENKENEKFIIREFSTRSFKRSFTVDDKIDADQIAAKYINGVLTLNLPRKVEVKVSTKEITIQ